MAMANSMVNDQALKYEALRASSFEALEEYPADLAVLVIDDEKDVRSVIANCLRKFKIRVSEAESLGEARRRFDGGERFSFVFLDRCLGDGDGVEFSKEIFEFQPELPVVIITGQGSIENANKALDEGVFDYLAKPCTISTIRQKFLGKYPCLSEEDGGVGVDVEIPEMAVEDQTATTLIANSAEMIRVNAAIRQIAAMSVSACVLGETGTGKELVARRIHEMSSRSRGRFVARNCGAISENLIESEFFGVMKGAFTGADRDRKGLFEWADGGTVFLDEITETSAEFQVKLLRVLQENCITRVGSNEEIKLDVRIIASSNRNLEEEIAAGRFRKDLYFRLKGSEIVIPPLKDRTLDILPLVVHFATVFGRLKKKKKVVVSAGVLEAFKAYDWPGNVRELESVMRFAVESSRSAWVLLSDLPFAMDKLKEDEVAAVGGAGEIRPLREVIDEAALKALKVCDGNISMAASKLKTDRSALGRRVRERGWSTAKEA